MKSSKERGDDGVAQVLVEVKGSARILTLNRPRQLNALSSQMITELLRFFTTYEKDPSVKLLIVKGKGRAFCAGGDVAAVVHSINEGQWTVGANFFWNEFRLNFLIATYSKPQVSLLNGIVMGGGAGVSIHGRFRVATETTVFAMPETALGLFPDIGASFFLSRLPGFFGEYVGLTGSRLNGAEMLACGLATHFVPSSKLASLEESLTKVDSSDHFAVCAVIDRYSEQVPLKENSAYYRLDIIDKCFSKKSVEEILSTLDQESKNSAEKWIIDAIESLKKASPTSLKISLRSQHIFLTNPCPESDRIQLKIREGRLQSVGQCLVREYRIICHIIRKEASKDFFEGCRALLVDKDKKPKWEPSRLDLVDDKRIDVYFSKVNDEGWEDLKLPERPATGARLGSKL